MEQRPPATIDAEFAPLPLATADPWPAAEPAPAPPAASSAPQTGGGSQAMSALFAHIADAASDARATHAIAPALIGAPKL